ncbi:MAG: xanthine phosphoribosyltransferase [Clostridia bacterium]|nr:xanthine phosphoribosyltransferase [Clostridia bacterium]
MKALEEKLQKEAIVLSADILKVGNFLNQTLDIPFIMEMGREIARLYEGEGVTKIVTIEASGIAIATAAAVPMQVPVVFAKKSRAATQVGSMYHAEVKSFTHGNTYEAIIPVDMLSADDRVLIIDDFLAHGAALSGLLSIIRQSGATLVGCAIAIEKGFQGGGDALRAEGVRIDSLARIRAMSPETGIEFYA